MINMTEIKEQFAFNIKHSMIIILIMLLMDYSDGQCFGCQSDVPLSPLSYSTMRSNVFNGIQPSNEGCTDGASTDGQGTIDCGQRTTLIDCDRGLTSYDYSDLSRTFAWNRTIVGEQVPIVFRFDQQVNISRITMFFWNSQSNSIIIPNVRLYWSNDDSITPSNEINITTSFPSRTGDKRRKLNVVVKSNDVTYQYLKIVMNFYGKSEWIFLSEVQFCGNIPRYYITQPSSDKYVQVVSSNMTTVTLSCSLNVVIPIGMVITWRHDGDVINKITVDQNTTNATQIRTDQPGVYQCTFNDTAGYILKRSITITLLGLKKKLLKLSKYKDCELIAEWMKSIINHLYWCAASANGDHEQIIIRWKSLISHLANDHSDCYHSDLGDRQKKWFIPEQTPTVDFNTASITTAATKTHTSVSNSASTSTTTTTTSTLHIVTIPTVSTTITTTTSILHIVTTPIVSTTTTTTTDTTSSSSDLNIGIIVGPIIIIIVIFIIVVALIVAFYWWSWRRKKEQYNIYDEALTLSAVNPYYTVNKSKDDEAKQVTSENAYINQETVPVYAIPDKQKKSNIKVQSSIADSDCKPPEISVQSQEQTQSMIIPDCENEIELDIYTAPDLPEYTDVTGSQLDTTDEDDPIYSEAIDPTVIIDGASHDSVSDNDNLCPYTSIYADPLPLINSEGPPIVSSTNIEPLSQLGKGHFGEVILANTVGLSYQYLGIGNGDDTTISLKVAVKILKSSSKEVQKAFEKEIKFMSRLKDDNVIRLLGICKTGTPFIMMEYMENGDLHNYLQQFNFSSKMENSPSADEIRLDALIYMSYQIASGMKYLSSCKFIHRDLAARNVLVGADYTVKIGDFGMSQNLYSAYYYKMGGRICLPIRWMAYECFFGKFSVKTDVWAFGITIWEIFTLCRFQPFNEFSDKELIKDATKGAKRKIPYRPEICPNDIYNIMKSCFHHEPSKRARFDVLCDQLHKCYSNIF